MPKYLILKHYRGGPQSHHPFPPMDQWAPEDVEAHMAFQHQVRRVLRENGEFVDAQALTPVRTWVRYGGPDAAPVTTDGPHPETSDLVAGWFMIDVESYERALEIAAYVSSEPGPHVEPFVQGIDVESYERALEIAAYVSSEPGPRGEPLYEWLDVREVMWQAPAED